MTPEQKAQHNELAKVIGRQIYVNRQHRDALEFARETGIDKEAKHETFSNGGFEGFVGNYNDTLFGWRLFRENKIDIGTDSAVKSEGSRSMKVNFRLYDKRELYEMSQIVTAEPEKRYRIDFKVRTENLRSGAMPLFSILSGKKGESLASSQPLPIGTANWQDMNIEFILPADEESFEIRLAREYCDDVCPLTGIFWVDDFRLTRV